MSVSTSHQRTRLEGTRASTGKPKPKPAPSKAKAKASAKKAPQFTKQQIIAAIKAHAKANNGQAPSSASWWPARLRQYSKAAKTKADAKRFEQQARALDGKPTTPDVVRVFGSWNAGIAAAGLTPKRAVAAKK